LCDRLLILPVYYPTMDGNYAEITRPFHIFSDLGVDLLLGIDTIREEGIDMFFSSTVPQMRIASCQNAAVKIDVRSGKQVTRVPVHTTAFAFTGTVVATSTEVLPDASCAEEQWSPPPWLQEQYQRAFMGMARRPAATPSSLEPEKASEESWCTDNSETVSSAAEETYIPTPPSLDRFNNNTGYEGVTFKERGCQRMPVLDRRGASLSFSFKLTVEPPSAHCSSVTLAETETPTTVPSPQCSSVTLTETKTSTTRTSVPLPSQLPVRFSAILPATPAAPRLPAPPPATRRLAALKLRFASMLMRRAMICRRITRQLIRWQVRPGRLKRRAK
jgi:hypothetical protein